MIRIFNKILAIILCIILLFTFNVTLASGKSIDNNVLIKGIVFVDSNGNWILDNGEKTLSNVKITIYENKLNNGSQPDNGILVYDQVKAKELKTDKTGVYEFNLQQADYTINLDSNSLPDGYGALRTDISMNNSNVNTNFIVREVSDIDISRDLSKGIALGDSLFINPELKDKFGNSLVGNSKISSDSNELKINGNMIKIYPKQFKDNKFKIIVSSGNVKTESSLDARVPNTTSFDKINIAYEVGIIDKKTKYLYELYSLYDQKRLPDEYKSSITSKCGTPEINEITIYLNSPEADKEVLSTYTTLTGNSISTLNNNNVPTNVEKIAAAFNTVKNIVYVTKGFRLPHIDGTAHPVNLSTLDGLMRLQIQIRIMVLMAN